jgi:hypothetical protein
VCCDGLVTHVIQGPNTHAKDGHKEAAFSLENDAAFS